METKQQRKVQDNATKPRKRLKQLAQRVGKHSLTLTASKLSRSLSLKKFQGLIYIVPVDE